MSPGAPSPEIFDVPRYVALVEDGALAPEDRVELLEGVVVAMPPQNPAHASIVAAVAQALARAIGDRAHLRTQLPLVLGNRSMPEPDCAVVAGSPRDFAGAHPESALLVVEVALSTLPQDRLTKAAIYAGAGIAEYWIVNLREDVLEVQRDPDGVRGLYATRSTAGRGTSLELVALPGAAVRVDDLLPYPDRR